MDELVGRLREFSGALSGEAERSWPDIASTLNGRALDVWHASDAITTLTAALEGLVAAIDAPYEAGNGKYIAALAAARAALREVGRG